LIQAPCGPAWIFFILKDGQVIALIHNAHAKHPFKGMRQRAVGLTTLGREVFQGNPGVEERRERFSARPEHGAGWEVKIPTR